MVVSKEPKNSNISLLSAAVDWWTLLRSQVGSCCQHAFQYPSAFEKEGQENIQAAKLRVLEFASGSWEGLWTDLGFKIAQPGGTSNDSSPTFPWFYHCMRIFSPRNSFPSCSMPSFPQLGMQKATKPFTRTVRTQRSQSFRSWMVSEDFKGKKRVLCWTQLHQKPNLRAFGPRRQWQFCDQRPVGWSPKWSLKWIAGWFETSWNSVETYSFLNLCILLASGHWLRGHT